MDRQGEERRGEVFTMNIDPLDLVVDDSIHPRTGIDETHVNRISGALRAGHGMPPLVVERSTKRVIDGVCRLRAHIKTFGSEMQITCVLEEYPDDNAAFIRAIELNADHGLALTIYDRTKCSVEASRRNIAPEIIARALRMVPEEVIRMVGFRTGVTRVGAEMERIALKGSMLQLNGEELSSEQAEINKNIGGMRPLYYVNQVRQLLRAGAAEWGGENLLTGLRELHAQLSEVLDRIVEPQQV